MRCSQLSRPAKSPPRQTPRKAKDKSKEDYVASAVPWLCCPARLQSGQQCQQPGGSSYWDQWCDWDKEADRPVFEQMFKGPAAVWQRRWTDLSWSIFWLTSVPLQQIGIISDCNVYVAIRFNLELWCVTCSSSLLFSSITLGLGPILLIKKIHFENIQREEDKFSNIVFNHQASSPVFPSL